MDGYYKERRGVACISEIDINKQTTMARMSLLSQRKTFIQDVDEAISLTEIKRIATIPIDAVIVSLPLSSKFKYSSVRYLFDLVLCFPEFCLWQCLFIDNKELDRRNRWWWFYDFWCLIQQYFSYIMATSFSGGRSRSTRREPPTMGNQLVNFITCGCESSAPFFVIYKAGREPTPYWQ